MKRSAVVGFAVGPLGAAVLGFVSLPLSTWIFSPADIGRLALLQTVTSVCIILFGAGLDQAYLREYHQAADRVALLRRTLLPGLYALLAAVAVVCLVTPQEAARLLFGLGRSSWIIGAALIVICAFISRFLSLVLRMAERGLAFSMSQVLPKALFICGLLVIRVWASPADFADLLWAHGISIAAATVIFAWNTRGSWRRPSVDNATIALSPLLRYGVPMMTAGLAQWVLQASDRLLLRHFATFGELGLYSVASGIASVAATVSTLFTTIWIPTAFKWATEPGHAERMRAVTRNLVAVAATLVSIAGMLSAPLVRFLPASYAPVQYIFVACTLPPLFYAISEVTGIGSSIERKGSQVLTASLLALFVNLVANVLLIPSFGAAGAAIGSALSFFAMLLARSEAGLRLLPFARRREVYGPAGIMTFTAVAYACTGARYPLTWQFLWCGLFALCAIRYAQVWSTLLLHFRTRTAP